jgi:hypothetical protein
LEFCYPNRFNFELPPASTLPDWAKQLERKSNLPFRRAFNKQACDQIKGPLGKASAGRYDVLNTSNTNTVEFRLFKGTMNPDSIFRYLEFVDAIVRFVPNTSALNSGLHYQVFLDWLTKDSFNVLRYTKLVAFLVSKNYIERTKIRKRDLPLVEETDGSQKPDPVVIPPSSSVVSVTNVNAGTLDLSSLSLASSSLMDDEDFSDGQHCGDPDCDTCNETYGIL